MIPFLHSLIRFFLSTPTDHVLCARNCTGSWGCGFKVVSAKKFIDMKITSKLDRSRMPYQ